MKSIQMKSTNKINQKIWITGASSGIGLSLARLYSAKGHTVFISSRNEKRLREISEELMVHNKNATGFTVAEVIPVKCDVCSEEDMVRAYGTIRTHTSYLDKVILNAGDCEYFSIQQPDWSAMKRMVDVNYLGAIKTLEVALPLLRELQERKAHIVGICSLATNAPFPKAEAYGSSKAALRYFLESLALDLQLENIDVTVVQPGFVKTPLTDKNDFSMPFLLGSDEAAARIIKGISKRPREFSFPKRLSYALKISRVLPRLWEKLMVVDIKKNQQVGGQQ